VFRFWCALILLTALFPLRLFATPDETIIAGLYARGLAGDKAAVVSCVAALEQVLIAQPNDQLARAYLGSAETLRSRDLPFGWEKLTTLRRGIALMDEAAAAVPNDARVQLIRAVTYEAFPAVLGRRQTARAAFAKLVDVVSRDPKKLQPADQQLLFLNAGEAAANAGDKTRAIDLWRRGAAIAADPRLTRELHDALHSAPN